LSYGDVEAPILNVSAALSMPRRLFYD